MLLRVLFEVLVIVRRFREIDALRVLFAGAAAGAFLRDGRQGARGHAVWAAVWGVLQVVRYLGVYAGGLAFSFWRCVATSQSTPPFA